MLYFYKNMPDFEDRKLCLIIGARVWLLVGFLNGFGGLIGACWVLFGAYVVPGTFSYSIVLQY